MSQWKNIAPVVALSISAALAGTGCAAQQGADDEATNDTDVAGNEPTEDAKPTPAMPTTDEKAGDGNTADAKQAWFGRCAFPFLGGCGNGIGLGGFFGGFPPFWAGWSCGGFGGGCGGGCF